MDSSPSMDECLSSSLGYRSIDDRNSLRDRSQDIKQQLKLLQAAIALLSREQNAIEKKLTSIVYPVLSLPVEITGKIFGYCLPDSLPDHTPDTRICPPPFEIPRKLSGVCSTWRDIAQATPKLWQAVDISLAHAHKPRYTINHEA